MERVPRGGQEEEAVAGALGGEESHSSVPGGLAAPPYGSPAGPRGTSL